jgi:hypothetical protein
MLIALWRDDPTSCVVRQRPLRPLAEHDSLVHIPLERFAMQKKTKFHDFTVNSVVVSANDA